MSFRQFFITLRELSDATMPFLVNWVDPVISIVRMCADRQRVSVDLRSLGPTVRAIAAERGLTLPALIRLSMSSLLQDSNVFVPFVSNSDRKGPADTKLTVRLHHVAAQDLARRARTSGLSYGSYVAMLLDGVIPSKAVDHALAVEALGRSTTLLAPALADLKHAARCAGSPADGLGADQIDVLAQAVHRHLLLASSLLAELRPVASARRHRVQVR